MIDGYGRLIEYLRVSVTELCNLRCIYCMGEEGIVKKAHDAMLTEEELIQAVNVAAQLGIHKVRITGGEPLVKRNIISICGHISEIPGIKNLGITTNGISLPGYAHDLKDAGVKNVNISLDTPQADKYSYITRGGDVNDVIRAIDAALDTGFDAVKVNAVLIKGINDDAASIRSLADLADRYDIDVRFIELMNMPCTEISKDNLYVPAQTVLQCLEGLIPDESRTAEGVADMYSMEGRRGRIGLITPLSHKFCGSCNRLRLTADGYIKPCLHSSDEYLIKGLDENGMKEMFEKAVRNKPGAHNMTESTLSQSLRSMNGIGG